MKKTYPKTLKEEKNLINIMKNELISIIDSIINERIMVSSQHNRIEVADIIVESHNENLLTCKKVMDDLIKQHGNFFIARKEKATHEHIGMFG